jgi:hypothetical protein
VQVGFCSVLGSYVAPPADTINGHLLYLDEDAFDISQRAWDFMRVHATAASNVPAVAPWLLGAALASAAALALRRTRQGKRPRRPHEGRAT